AQKHCVFLGLFVFEGVWWIHMVVCSPHPLFFVFVGVLGPLCTRHLRLGASVDKHKLFASMKSCFGLSMVVDK
ncbi:hypothetical protein, partial [Corynebacterium glutamicum]|uniref:hypothetical protein n=1 Tax=Corynebacterium glutamicum TaxID=1718 RepID=UPI001C68E705